MNNYNLMEFGGSGNIIATAICDFTCNGYNYKKGDIVLSLPDVSIHFNYGTKTSNANSSRNQVYYSEYYLDNFIVDIAPFSLATQKLFANLTFSGKKLVVAMALNPSDYVDSKYKFKDMSEVRKYAETPFVMKVTSGLKVRQIKELLTSMFVSEGLENQHLDIKVIQH